MKNKKKSVVCGVNLLPYIFEKLNHRKKRKTSTQENTKIRRNINIMWPLNKTSHTGLYCFVLHNTEISSQGAGKQYSSHTLKCFFFSRLGVKKAHAHIILLTQHLLQILHVMGGTLKRQKKRRWRFLWHNRYRRGKSKHGAGEGEAADLCGLSLVEQGRAGAFRDSKVRRSWMGCVCLNRHYANTHTHNSGD